MSSKYLLFILTALTVGCASSRSVQREYQASIFSESHSATRHTTVVFLIDGLSPSMLIRHFRRHPTSAIHRFFLGGKHSFPLAHTVFPSLTYPAVASLTTQSPVDHHGIIGNQLGSIDFTQPVNLPVLNEKLRGKTVFSRLSRQGRTSVSLSYAFHESADASIQGDLRTGLAYLRQHYSAIDTTLLESLNYLLKKTPLQQLPDFVFVHLIGVDALAHRHGPDSEAVSAYLGWLDRALNPTFSLLSDLEQQGIVPVSLLLSDHGFTAVRQFFDLDSAIHALSPDTRIENQARHATLYFPGQMSIVLQSQLLDSLLQYPSVEIAAHRIGDDLRIRTSRSQALLHYHRASCGEFTFALSLQIATPRGNTLIPGTHCPQDLDRLSVRIGGAWPYPLALKNIAAFFHARNHPHAVVIAAPGLSFSMKDRDKTLGEHGGLTPEESLIPLLLRNATLTSETNLVPISSLLSFLAPG